MAAMISRDWSCLNRACARQFHSFEAYPTCPHCGCVKVSWVPGGCHVPKVAPEADRTVTKLARIYNLTDMNSARRYECAKKIAPQPDASSQPMWSFGAGFNMQAHPDQAMCSPTKTPINFRIATSDSALPASRSIPGPAANATIHYEHKGALPSS